MLAPFCWMFSLARSRLVLVRNCMLCAGAVLVAAGCVVIQPAVKHYEGPALPPSQIATLESYSNFYGLGGKAVTIVTIDGKRSPECAQLLPGHYVVGMKYDAMAGELTITGLAPCFVTLEAEAGHTYRTNGEISRGAWQCWLEDLASSKRTMGVFVRGGVAPAAASDAATAPELESTATPR